MDKHITSSLTDGYQYGILSLPFVLDYIRDNFSYLQVKSVSPHSFAIGSNHNSEGLEYDIQLENSLFFGSLFVSISPNLNDLENEVIELRYRSYFNTRPYWKYVRRIVEQENLINEETTSTQLFDKIELTQISDKYDIQVTFVGFKIDVN